MITDKALEWRDKVAQELPHNIVAVAPTRINAQVDYAHLIVNNVNIEIVYHQTIKLPATDSRPNELEWTETGWVVIYSGDDSDTSPRTIYLHPDPEKGWAEVDLLHEIIGAFWFVSE
jgi:hypothetical protein